MISRCDYVMPPMLVVMMSPDLYPVCVTKSSQEVTVILNYSVVIGHPSYNRSLFAVYYVWKRWSNISLMFRICNVSLCLSYVGLFVVGILSRMERMYFVDYQRCLHLFLYVSSCNAWFLSRDFLFMNACVCWWWWIVMLMTLLASERVTRKVFLSLTCKAWFSVEDIVAVVKNFVAHKTSRRL